MNTPLLILIYNRPKETQVLIKKLKKLKPKCLYIFSDGPKKNNNDFKLNLECKKIIDKINWTTQIKKKYLNKNHGCKLAVSAGLDWFFKNEKKGIILEDDCIPSTSFFRFCTWGLNKFENNKKIGSITGNNFLKSQVKIKSSYYFSKYAHCWGWATWRNRWKLYNKDISFWKKWKSSKNFKNIFNLTLEEKYWIKIFNNSYKNKIDSWAYPWNLCLWYNDMLVLTPKNNLVENIGIGSLATHTYIRSDNVNYKTRILKKPYKNLNQIRINTKADNFVFNNHFRGKNYLWPYRFIYILKILISNPGFIILKFKKFLNV